MKTKIVSTLFTTLPLIAGMLVVLEIISINRFVRSGKDIQSINSSIDALTQDNAMLSQRIASYSSIAAVSDRAKQLGFMPPTASQYQTILPDQVPVALKIPQ